MNLVGKILVAVILVFSIAFAVMASAVYHTQTNWRTAYNTQADALQRAQAARAAAQQEAAAAQQAEQAALLAQQQEMSLRQTAERNLEQVTQQFQDDNRRLAEDNARLQQLAVGSQQELEELRNSLAQTRNYWLEAVRARDAAITEQQRLESELFVLQADYATLQEQYAEQVQLVAHLQGALDRLGVDPTQIEGPLPPPRVYGYITDAPENSDLVEISLGTDDGLAVGHELYVYRTGDERRYLGQVRVIDADGDRAVARIINREGPIRRNDRVATQLR